MPNDATSDGLPGATPATALLLHFFGGTSRTWTEARAALDARGVRTIAPDLRGFGDAMDAAGPFTVDAYADDIVALAAREAGARWTLVGHSMGGKIAFAVAARRPLGLASLVLVAPSPPWPEPMSDADRARLRAAYGDRAPAAVTIDGIVAHPLTGAVRERTLDDELRASADAWHAWLDAGSREDLAARAPNVAVPVTVLAGEKDRGITPAVAGAVAAALGGSAVTVPDAGHLLPLEATNAVVAAIAAATGSRQDVR
ncbi:MAG TPA: alpha/beta fold hydrolase [Gemmatirosa sp.]